MENKKQTAVEFLAEKLEKLIPSGNQLIINLMLTEAKELEKKQIIDAYDSGNRKGYDENILSAKYDLDEQYYNENYGK